MHRYFFALVHKKDTWVKETTNTEASFKINGSIYGTLLPTYIYSADDNTGYYIKWCAKKEVNFDPAVLKEHGFRKVKTPLSHALPRIPRVSRYLCIEKGVLQPVSYYKETDEQYKLEQIKWVDHVSLYVKMVEREKDGTIIYHLGGSTKLVSEEALKSMGWHTNRATKQKPRFQWKNGWYRQDLQRFHTYYLIRLINKQPRVIKMHDEFGSSFPVDKLNQKNTLKIIKETAKYLTKKQLEEEFDGEFTNEGVAAWAY